MQSLPSSRLGTLRHWDNVYEREVVNFQELGDEGEVWFGEETVQRMVDFVENELESASIFPKNPSVLDVGTGNGHILFALLELEPPLTQSSRMLGIDYSQLSVDLCRKIAEKRGGSACEVTFKRTDFLREFSKLQGQGWDLVCDKGTLDAVGCFPSSVHRLTLLKIALSHSEENEDDPVRQYADSLVAITVPGNIFLITSCNFTQEELRGIFHQRTSKHDWKIIAHSFPDFEVYHVVPVPSFTFGGHKGSTTVTIAFRRK